MTISKLVNTCESWNRSRWNDTDAGPEQRVHVRQQLQTGVFSSQMIERMRGDKNWTWTPVAMNQRVRSCGKVLSPVNIQFLLSSRASAWHPQDKALHLPPSLCSFLFLFLNLHFLPSLPQPPSARTPSPYFDVSKCHQQPHRLCITGWLTADLWCFGLTLSWWCWWIRQCRLVRGPVWSEKCCWFDSHQQWGRKHSKSWCKSPCL